MRLFCFIVVFAKTFCRAKAIDVYKRQAPYASDLPATNMMSDAERVANEAGETKNGTEKDVEANDMLDLDSFFS